MSRGRGGEGRERGREGGGERGERGGGREGERGEREGEGGRGRERFGMRLGTAMNLTMRSGLMR